MPLLRVYLVEDSPLIRANLIDTLEELAPIEVVGSAESEEDALKWIDDHPADWDLLIVDMFLKSGSGSGVLRHCRDRDPERKAVVFTNYATPDMRQHCLKLGADVVYDKSNEIDALIAYCAELGRSTSMSGELS